jgi:glycosyltransferase involved in cell wall biosynthesis
MNRPATIVLIGALPPPVMGLAVVNAAMQAALREAGAQLLLIDIAPRPRSPAMLERGYSVARARLPAMLKMARLAATRRNTAVYCGLSGGWGQIFDLPTLALARLAGFPVTVHHHNYTYLDRRKLLSRLLFAVLGRRTRHIVLSAAMGETLTRLYPSVGTVEVLSNAALIDVPAREAPRTGPLRTLGFLSNVTMEKGIGRFIALVAELRARGLPVRGRVAGPLAQPEAARIVQEAAAKGLIEQVGPVGGAAKRDFLESVDLFVLPSLYAFEAEPLVLHEALAAGLPVIATARGSIPSLVDDEIGCLLDRDAADLSPAIARVEAWSAEPERFDRVRAAALARARANVLTAEAARRSVVALILADAGSRAGR